MDPVRSCFAFILRLRKCPAYGPALPRALQPFIESSLNLNSYKVSNASLSPEGRPELRRGLGNNTKLGLALPLSRRFSAQVLAGYSAECISSAVRRTSNSPAGSFTYPFELNALQHLIDLETKMAVAFPIGRLRVEPSLGVGSSIGFTEGSNGYGYLVPGLQFNFGRAGLQASYKFAHYNIEPAQNANWFQTQPHQFLVRPRVAQLGLHYRLQR